MCDQMIESVSTGTKKAEDCFELNKMRAQELQNQLTSLKTQQAHASGTKKSASQNGVGSTFSQEETELQRAIEASKRVK